MGWPRRAAGQAVPSPVRHFSRWPVWVCRSRRPALQRAGTQQPLPDERHRASQNTEAWRNLAAERSAAVAGMELYPGVKGKPPLIFEALLAQCWRGREHGGACGTGWLFVALLSQRFRPVGRVSGRGGQRRSARPPWPRSSRASRASVAPAGRLPRGVADARCPLPPRDRGLPISFEEGRPPPALQATVKVISEASPLRTSSGRLRRWAAGLAKRPAQPPFRRGPRASRCRCLSGIDAVPLGRARRGRVHARAGRGLDLPARRSFSRLRARTASAAAPVGTVASIGRATAATCG